MILSCVDVKNKFINTTDYMVVHDRENNGFTGWKHPNR